MSQTLKKKVIKAFKMYGFTLRKDASDLLFDTLILMPEGERDAYLEKFRTTMQNQDLTSGMVGSELVQKVIEECEKEGEKAKGALFVFDAFDFPKYTYKTENNKFYKREPQPKDKQTFGNANDKAQSFQDRYWLLHQRTSRHRLFTPAATGVNLGTQQKKFCLKNVEYLLGCTSKLKEIIVLGMISRIHEGKFHLEDPTGVVEMNLKAASFQTGLFTENTFVLAEGWYEDQVFNVEALGFPPLEPAKNTKSYYGNLNFFSDTPTQCPKALIKLRQAEKEEAGAIVFLSDIYLDQTKTLERLETMLRAFDSCPPACFVFSGRFCSVYGSSHVAKLKEGLQKLGEIITKFPNVEEESQFVFVPSLQDCGLNKMLPRPSLPASVTKDFCKKIPKAIFTSNPCRIQYFTQEIIIYRDDLMRKMCKNSLRCPTADLPENLMKTLHSQSYLSPLPMHINPIYWKHSHALQIYPLPDLLVLCDKYASPYHVAQFGCNTINPGSFSSGDFNFKVYCADTRTIEDSKIDA